MSYARQTSYSATYSTQWKVPSSWSYGYLHIGSRGSSMKWRLYQYYVPCTVLVIRSGSTKLPYQAHWTWHNRSQSGGVNQK